ncbi:hypothetical protein NWT09_03385 [Mycolicibacterium sp. jd]|uniref:hypothetical protein n=1 Tax=unclassified Mycolicibacterium TaxID=2636767 RepID=UPI00351ABBB1
MPESAQLVDNVQAWLSRNGWRQVSEGRAGSMWVHKLFGDGERVGVVKDLTEDSRDFCDLVQRLSGAHGVTTDQIAMDLRNWAIDITYLRAANDIYITDTIPLVAGAAMLESARMMFRAAATAAVKVRPSINGSFSKLGDEVADQVRVGHTIRGSYVVPVLVKVGEEQHSQGTLFSGGEEQASFESLERRATRTFAQAFAAVQEQIVKPEKSPSGEQLQELVARGVTREFASAMARVLSEPAVASLDANFRWAPSQGRPTDTPTEVEIPSSAAPKIVDTSRRLRAARRPRHEIFTGPVVVVAREPEDEQTRFAIRTIRGGQPCRIETRTSAPLDEVLEWMRLRTTIQVTGNVARRASGLQIEEPVEVAAFTTLDGQEHSRDEPRTGPN